MKQILAVIFIVFICCSCSKKSNNIIGEDTRCINQIFPNQNTFLVAQADYNYAVNFFQVNNLTFDNLQFYRITYDTIVLTGNYLHVNANQFVNSLLVFYGSIGYHFRNGQYYFLSGYRYPATNNNINNIPSLRLTQVRKLWADATNTYYNGRYSNFQDSCVNATFGYIDTAQGYSTQNRKLVKAWYVTPANRSYPEAFFFDDNGKTYSFFDGIIN